MAMHWYKETHGECVSQTYRIYELDEIGDDFEAAKKAAFNLLNRGDTLVYGDPEGAHYAYGNYMTLSNVKHMAQKRMVRVKDMPEGSIPQYVKYHHNVVYFWYDEDDYPYGFYLEFIPKKDILNSNGNPVWNRR